MRGRYAFALVVATLFAMGTLLFADEATAKLRRPKRQPSSARVPPIAYYLASVGVKASSREDAIAKCMKESRRDGDGQQARVRCARRVVVVRGPYKASPPRKDEDSWYAPKDYPYRGSDGKSYSADGYEPTP
jgi:hypothetical protein